jgi:hypothetical protein
MGIVKRLTSSRMNQSLSVDTGYYSIVPVSLSVDAGYNRIVHVRAAHSASLFGLNNMRQSRRSQRDIDGTQSNEESRLERGAECG